MALGVDASQPKKCATHPAPQQQTTSRQSWLQDIPPNTGAYNYGNPYNPNTKHICQCPADTQYRWHEDTSHGPSLTRYGLHGDQNIV